MRWRYIHTLNSDWPRLSSHRIAHSLLLQAPTTSPSASPTAAPTQVRACMSGQGGDADWNSRDGRRLCSISQIASIRLCLHRSLFHPP